MRHTVQSPGLVQLLFLALASLTACASPASPSTAVASPTLRPLATPSATASGGTATATVAPLPSPGPSPTPFTHVVQAKDTLLAIAARYNLTLEQLEAANPGIDPRILSIGQALIIPSSEGGEVIVFPTSTPHPLVLSAPHCYRAVSGSLSCLLTVHNDTDTSMEGLIALVSLVGPDGPTLLTESAYSPLNVLPSGQTTVLAAYIPAPAPTGARVVAELVSSVPVGDPAGRYADVTVDRSSQEPAEDRMSWRVHGEVQLSQEATGAGAQVSVILLAFDAGNEVVGFTKWESETGLVAGADVPFDATVYSLGLRIDHVDVLAEAQLNAFSTPLAPTP
jgi:LysM repeat protein